MDAVGHGLTRGEKKKKCYCVCEKYSEYPPDEFNEDGICWRVSRKAKKKRIGHKDDPFRNCVTADCVIAVGKSCGGRQQPATSGGLVAWDELIFSFSVEDNLKFV